MYATFSLDRIQLTKYLFFTGKGGVGKTSIACAVAVNLADRGKRCSWSAPTRPPICRMCSPPN